MELSDREKIITLTENYIRDSAKPRPEKLWLDETCRCLMVLDGIGSKAELDRILYRRTFGTEPDTSGVLKIRYWRTGRHYPTGRDECVRFGDALMLSAEDKRFLIRNYFDRCDEAFTGKEIRSFLKEKGESAPREAYRHRIRLLDTIKEEYLARIHPSVLLQAGIAPKYVGSHFRHLYYMDSFHYVSQDSPDFRRSDSTSFDPEIRRIMRLEGEISRRTMLRHLIILMSPFLSPELLSERLVAFGFCGLSAEHSGLHGERTDAFVLSILELYTETCTGKDPETCLSWIRDAFRAADGHLQKTSNERLRVMHYKAQGQ